jgi:two-component sensor histidine kinase
MSTQSTLSLQARSRNASGEYRILKTDASPRFSVEGEFVGLIGVNVDITETVEAAEALRAREQHTKLLLQEVSHRAKNMLAVTQAIIRQTSRDLEPKAFAERLSARLAGLAASHDLLVKSEWRPVDMHDLVRAQLSHWSDLVGTRISITGPPCGLGPASAQALGMAIHELATNAGKYGALSQEGGFVELQWRMVGNGSGDRIEVAWTERGGPEVVPPTRRGFGHAVMVRMVEHALDANVTLDYHSEGLRWTMSAPVQCLMGGVSHDLRAEQQNDHERTRVDCRG